MTVTVSDGAGIIGMALVGSSGIWSITPAAPLSDGTYSLSAVATDAYGNVSAASHPFSLTIDAAPPPAPSDLALAAASDSGMVGDDITNKDVVTVTGAAGAGSTVTLSDAAGGIGSAIADPSGRWSITTSRLADGTYGLQASATDIAGTKSATASAPLRLTIDTTPPAAPVDLALAGATGDSTDDATPTITGLGEAGATIVLYDGAERAGAAVVGAASTWSVTTSALSPGDHSFSAAQTDLAGNLSAASTILAVDVAAPPPDGHVTLPGGGDAYSAVAGQVIQAGSGSDTVTAAAGQVTVDASSGALTFFGGVAASSVSGGAGSTTLFGGAGGGVYVGGAAGQGILVSEGEAGVVTRFVGTGAGDRIFGSALGNDMLEAGAGRDSILGGGGATTITGGGAASVIFTGGGPTTVDGGVAGGDTIVGGAGALAVAALNGDAVFGNGGALSVTGSLRGADSIVGGAGTLDVAGRGGNMLVVAGTGLSDVATGNGASLMFAGSGNLSLVGGSGSMQIVAGSGNARIDEGTGAATLQIVDGAAGGSDVISGFRPGTDRIELFGYQPSQISNATAGGATMLSLADGTKVTLLGVGDIGPGLIG